MLFFLIEATILPIAIWIAFATQLGWQIASAIKEVRIRHFRLFRKDPPTFREVLNEIRNQGEPSSYWYDIFFLFAVLNLICGICIFGTAIGYLILEHQWPDWGINSLYITGFGLLVGLFVILSIEDR